MLMIKKLIKLDLMIQMIIVMKVRCTSIRKFPQFLSWRFRPVQVRCIRLLQIIRRHIDTSY